MLKDAQLDWLANQGCNVAQFVSYGPDGKQRYSRIRESQPNQRWRTIQEAVEKIYQTQNSPSVNIRSFLLEKPGGNPFIYGIKNANEAAKIVSELISQGYFVIINETIDVNDGGFSGVLFGDVMEVSPFETPQCVEKPGTMAIPRKLGKKLINTVYNFKLKTPFTKRERIEFSIHPLKVGYLREHQIIWQVDSYTNGIPTAPSIKWPNNFSRAIGDKAFGLLIASLLGFKVPRTIVIGRYVPKFSFGQPTGTSEVWLRTCAKEQIPGKFPTLRGWKDPFRLMQDCDPTGENIVSLLIQEGVDAKYSGAIVVDANGNLIIEGKRGYGDVLMVGKAEKEKLPRIVESAIRSTYQQISAFLDDVRFEWVFDGSIVWIVQLHLGKTESIGSIIFPGEPSFWIDVNIADGLENLRKIVTTLPKNTGIKLHGKIGITSHFGDLLRRAKIPSRLEW